MCVTLSSSPGAPTNPERAGQIAEPRGSWTMFTPSATNPSFK